MISKKTGSSNHEFSELQNHGKIDVTNAGSKCEKYNIRDKLFQLNSYLMLNDFQMRKEISLYTLKTIRYLSLIVFFCNGLLFSQFPTLLNKQPKSLLKNKTYTFFIRKPSFCLSLSFLAFAEIEPEIFLNVS